MGLFRKISEARMKDPVEGTVRITGMTMPSPDATSCNYRMEGVISGPGITPTAITHRGMMSTRTWPSIGQDLPVTVDRADPTHFVIETERLVSGRQQAMDAAQALAESMRQQQAAQQGGGSQSTGLPPGFPQSTVPQSSSGFAGGIDQQAIAMAQQLAAQFGGGTTSVTVNGVPVQMGGGTPQAGAGQFGGAQFGAGQFGGAQFGGQPPAPQAVSNADLLARGTPGHATVLGTYPSPMPSPKPGRTSIGLMLNVLVDGTAPYQTQTLYAVPDEKVGRVVAGALLPVRVDPSTPQLVGVDWDAF